MIVRSEKLAVENTPENACPNCDGAGKIRVVPLDGKSSSFVTSCWYCFGEKSLTPDLMGRRIEAEQLRKELARKGLSTREAAQKFSQSFRDWIDARSGRAPIEEIRAKIDLLDRL